MSVTTPTFPTSLVCSACRGNSRAISKTKRRRLARSSLNCTSCPQGCVMFRHSTWRNLSIICAVYPERLHDAPLYPYSVAVLSLSVRWKISPSWLGVRSIPNAKTDEFDLITEVPHKFSCRQQDRELEGCSTRVRLDL